MPDIRAKLVPAVVLLLSITARVVITLLQQRAGDGRQAQIELANLTTALTQLQTGPFRSSLRTGGSPAVAALLMQHGKMRRHTLIGERVMLAAPLLAPTAELVRSSFGRFDGTGYPDGLRGEAIPLGGRIIAVCDAFDVMVTGRPYRDAITPDDALEGLRRCAGTQLDPRVVEAFCALATEHLVVTT